MTDSSEEVTVLLDLDTKIYLYSTGQTIEEALAQPLLGEYRQLRQFRLALKRSIADAKIQVSVPLQSFIPPELCSRQADVVARIQDYIKSQFRFQPPHYQFFAEFGALLQRIGKRKLTLTNLESLVDERGTTLRQKITSGDISPYIRYKLPFKTRTGRLTLKSGSFPILTCDKIHRHILRPNHGCFLELDYNCFEMRVMLGLLGQPQPAIDFHEHNRQRLGLETREEAKRQFFSWLFDVRKRNTEWERLYHRFALLEQYWLKREIALTKYYGRHMPTTDPNRALNNIVQGTAQELFAQQVLKLDQMLHQDGSGLAEVAFMVHDSVVLDMTAKEAIKVPKWSELFCATDMGTFPVNAKIGPDFGHMIKIETSNE